MPEWLMLGPLPSQLELGFSYYHAAIWTHSALCGMCDGKVLVISVGWHHVCLEPHILPPCTNDCRRDRTPDELAKWVETGKCLVTYLL
jgi:hypothetical protein